MTEDSQDISWEEMMSRLLKHTPKNAKYADSDKAIAL
jgi:hypothetical protein